LNISIRNIDVAFGKQEVLKQISLSFRQGEFVAVLGPSDTGKSTLLRYINGFVIPKSGQVLVIMSRR